MELLTSNVLLLGLIANTFSFIKFIPTVIKIIQERNNTIYSRNIENGQIIIMVLGQSLWIWYGFLIKQPLLALYPIVDMPIAFLMFYMKNIRFKNFDNKEINKTNNNHKTKEKQRVDKIKFAFIITTIILTIMIIIAPIFFKVDTKTLLAMIGFVANVCSLFTFVPMTLEAWKMRNDKVYVKNISNSQTRMILWTAIAWLLYGLSLESFAVMFTSLLNIPISIFLFYIKNFRKIK